MKKVRYLSMGMHIKKALKIIKNYEGLALKTYYCPSGVLTIGYGHTGNDDKKGMVITKKQANELLKKDLVRFKKEVMKYDSVYHWNENEYQALLSFAYNIGSIHQLTANGTRTKEQISKVIPLYCRGANGNKLQGLVKRRLEEQKLFNKEV